ncbi:Spo0E family sporulation regulatory protein-aspartic acid phosphatase [Clostridium punense]|uniref:Spo0E family sporulation regulatory protein-aspartic acid phosphatase n=1 Tax=Clostridium punense TaxID=1054297 RepID=UPI001AE86BAD
MILKIRILKHKINSFKKLLHFLLTFRKPTDRIVVFCSQQLDQYIVQYQKLHKKIS